MVRSSRWWPVALVVLVGCAHAPRPLPEVARAEVYTGADDLRVEVVRLEGPGNRCVVRVRNAPAKNFSDHAFDCTVVTDRDTERYRIMRDGAGWHVLDRSPRFTRSWIPDQRDPRPLTLDPAASAALDVRALLEANAVETANGTLAKLAAFDRPARVAAAERDLRESVTAATAACGVEVKATHELASASEALLQEWALGTICGEVFGAIADLCASAPGRAFFRTEVTAVHCAFGPDRAAPSVFALDGHTLRFTMNDAEDLRERARTFLGNVGSSGKANDVPWGDGAALKDRVALADVMVCADEGGHVLALDRRTGASNSDRFKPTLFAGTRAALSAVPRMSRFEDQFPDPRHRRTDRPPDEQFRSSVSMDPGKRECTVTCGSHDTRVPMLAPEEGAKLLLAAKLVPPPFTRRPHALLRDAGGAYYFVDTSTLEGREKDFQVWVGQRGRMKRQQLVNALSDSAGDLFTTKSGALRLSLDREQTSYWHEGKTKRPLRVVPVDANLDLIFLELGVYAGARLGTPCDDF